MKTKELERERILIKRTIWCNLHKSYKPLIECKDCLYRDNCQHREKGAMRKVKVNFDNWII